MFPLAEEPGASRFRVMHLSTTDHFPCSGGREEGREERREGGTKRIILQFKHKTLASLYKLDYGKQNLYAQAYSRVQQKSKHCELKAHLHRQSKLVLYTEGVWNTKKPQCNNIGIPVSMFNMSCSVYAILNSWTHLIRYWQLLPCRCAFNRPYGRYIHTCIQQKSPWCQNRSHSYNRSSGYHQT